MEEWQKNRVPTGTVPTYGIFFKFFLNFRQYGRMTEKSGTYIRNIFPFLFKFRQYVRMTNWVPYLRTEFSPISFWILDNMEEWQKNRVPTYRIFSHSFLNFRQYRRMAKNSVPTYRIFSQFFLNFRQYGRMTEKSGFYEKNFLPFFLNLRQYRRMEEKSGSYLQNFLPILFKF